MKVLSKSFIDQYKNKESKMTNMGKFVFVRSYSRWLEDEKRREYWYETVARTVEYVFQREIKHRQKNNLPIDMESLRKEAEGVMDRMFNLKQFSSGRTMWVGGTEVGEKYGMANYNCSFTIIEKFEDFIEIFYLLMLGSGVGFRTLKTDIDKVEPFRNNIELQIKPYKAIEKPKRKEFTELNIISDDKCEIVVGDSKEGWTESLSIYFKLITEDKYKDIKTIVLNFDNVRPKGERLKRFGGFASGHTSLERMFIKIHDVIKRTDGKLNTIDALDIGNIIAENVVSGGVRRSSEVNLSDRHDEDIADAKNNLFKLDENGDFIVDENYSHRFMSNNSIAYKEKGTRWELHEDFVNMKNTGERGLVNFEAARKRRPDMEGVNPCVEILLGNKGLCNLTTVNVFAFVEDGKVNLEEMVETFKSSARMGLRMTLIDLELPEWDKRQKEDRLIGASLTGWFDMVDAANLSKEEQIEILKTLKKAVRTEADNFAEELKINKPLLTTTVKPEGTISQLPSVSSGLHRDHAPYYIRRIRISATDPLVGVLKELDYPLSPENGQTWENAETLVVEFPIKSPVKTTKFDITGIEQLETYKMFMDHYVEHNASITVSLRPHEWEEAEQWVWDHWDEFIGISFMPLSDSVYQQAPYEEISKEEYERRSKDMKEFDISLLQKYEDTGEDFEVGSDCESGICPIR